MKSSRFLPTLFALFFSSSLMAQFGFHAGPVIRSSQIKFEMESGAPITIDFKSSVGFMGGVNYRTPLGTSLAFQPELNFMQKGGKQEETSSWEESYFNVNYLELPLYFLYTGGNYSGFYAGAGPAINLGISGKFKYDSESEDIEFGNDEDLKRSHIAVNVLAGYRLKRGFDVSAFFSRSLTSSTPGENPDLEGPNWSFTNFGLRIGYTLGGGEMRGSRVKLKQVL